MHQLPILEHGWRGARLLSVEKEAFLFIRVEFVLKHKLLGLMSVLKWSDMQLEQLLSPCSSPLPGLKRSVWMGILHIHACPCLQRKYSRVMVAKQPTLLPSLKSLNSTPTSTPQIIKKKLIGIPHSVSTGILLIKLAIYYVFACVSALKYPTWKRKIQLAKKWACSTYTALLRHLLLLQ